MNIWNKYQNTELYDCCKVEDGSTLHTLCDSIGGFNSLVLTVFLIMSVVILLGLFVVPFKKWLLKESNRVLILVCFFHVLTIVWRALLYFKVGHPEYESDSSTFIIWKSSAIGDLGNSLAALAVYLHYFVRKHSQQE